MKVKELQKLNNSQRKIIDTLKTENALTYSELAKLTELSYDGVRGRISELSNMGYMIERFRDNGQTLLKYNVNGSRMPTTNTEKLIIKSNSFDDFKDISTFLEKIRTTKYKDKKYTKKRKKVNETALLVLSDLHIGELIEDQTYGNITYNTMVAEERMENLTNYILDELYNREINNLTISMLGDMVDGDMIYKNHIFRVEKPAIEQVQDAVKLLSEMIKTLSANGITIDVHTVRGNHGITNYKNLEEDNWDNVIYNMLELVFYSDENVDIIAHPNSESCINVLDKKVVMTHGENIGEQIKTASGLKEFRGICSKHKLNDGDMLLVGHLHSFGVEYDQNKLIIRNGALSDTSEYAYKKNLASVPEQTLLILTEGAAYPEIIPIEL